MGHIRLGRLAKTHAWADLVALLDLDDVEVARVAATTTIGAQNRLQELRHDPVLGYAMWLLSRLATAAQSDDFVGNAAQVGLRVAGDDSALVVIARINALMRQELEQHPASGPFGEIASLALRRALLETVGVEQPSLFGSTLSDLERAFRQGTTDRAFGDLSRRFFGDYLARTLRYYLDKELPFHIGPGTAFATIEASSDFVDDLDTYTRQSARIVETFAADWLSKYAFHETGQISREHVQSFVATAMSKLCAELRGEVVA